MLLLRVLEGKGEPHNMHQKRHLEITVSKALTVLVISFSYGKSVDDPEGMSAS